MMRRLVLLITFAALAGAFPALAQNNCVSFKCYNPPPYNCPYCDTTMYNGAAGCTTGTFGSSGFCFLSGSCDTGMGNECEETAAHHCTDMQDWARWFNLRPLSEEWKLVRVQTVSSRGKRHRA
jgi:hypothetical protein